mmetsp:Transcript_106901/g.276436  ORF Transcript_106901/g.276436 Transcript_106901/m.276436 type:complete len:209 (-) Transcript_106901:225-851(-)
MMIDTGSLLRDCPQQSKYAGTVLKSWKATFVGSLHGAGRHRASPRYVVPLITPTPSRFKQFCMKKSSPQPFHLRSCLHRPLKALYVPMAFREKTSREPKSFSAIGPLCQCRSQFPTYSAGPSSDGVFGRSCERRRSGKKTASGSTLTVQSWFHHRPSPVTMSHIFMNTIVLSHELVVVPATERSPMLTGGAGISSVNMFPTCNTPPLL